MLFATHEQQPLVILEAMSCHKPWICTNVGSVGEMKGGIVLKNRSPKHLLDALETMQNPLTRKRYGDEGFKQWRESYSPENVYARWDRLLDDIIVKKTVGNGY
jgi:glycosyltransferase involved in cell wall biosynthesis